jgi:hypothetical protein
MRSAVALLAVAGPTAAPVQRLRIDDLWFSRFVPLVGKPWPSDARNWIDRDARQEIPF